MKVWTRVKKCVFSVELYHLYHMEGGGVCVPPFCIRLEDFMPEEAAEIVFIIVL